jgi:hypothetical protein
MHQYLKDCVKWIIECKRLLADNGTLFWYGYAKNIAIKFKNQTNVAKKLKKYKYYICN